MLNSTYSDIATLLNAVHWTYDHQRMLVSEIMVTWRRTQNPAWNEYRASEAISAAISLGYVTPVQSIGGYELELTEAGRQQVAMPHQIARSTATNNSVRPCSLR